MRSQIGYATVNPRGPFRLQFLFKRVCACLPTHFSMIEHPHSNNNNPLLGVTSPREDITSDININKKNNNNNNNIDNILNPSFIYNNINNDQINLHDNNDNILPTSLQIATHNIRGTLGRLS